MSQFLFLLGHHQLAPAIEGVFGKDWCMDLWREEKLPSQRREPVETDVMTSMGAQVSESPFFQFSLTLNRLSDCCVCGLLSRRRDLT